MSNEDGNRVFSRAMFALENGEFDKSEKLLKETIEIFGNTHHISMLAMKTLAGIATDKNRLDDALTFSLDLLDAQIQAYGITHSESSRTVTSILDLCRQLGKDDVAEDVARMVEAATEQEKAKSTNSFRMLRQGESAAREPGAIAKLFKWLGGGG